MNSNFLGRLNEVLGILSSNNKLGIKDSSLVSINENKILTPAGDIYSLLSKQKSKLKDQFVDLELVQKFVDILTTNNAIVRLNHFGFCYKVDSQRQEKERLLKLVKDSTWHMYMEPSNDEGMWFFVGNTDNWEDMLLELIPIERTEDNWIDYWLPHVQIDIDTTLTEEEIKKYATSVFGTSVVPFSIAIEGVVYIVRNRLGTIDGINITLDMATNARNVKNQRLNLLKKVDN